MTRWAQFRWHQWRAFRALFRRRRPVLVFDPPAESSHPSTLCKCFGPIAAIAPNRSGAA